MTTSDGTAPFRPAAREALTAAMKARDAVAVGALRAVIAAIDNAEAADPAHAPAQQPGPIAGGVKGLGAGEVPRRTLGDAEVRQTTGKVLVDFWAEWCGPCRTVAPVLDELEGEHPEVRFVQLNVDENPSVAQGYEVMSIPTLLAFEGGAVVKRVVGALPKTKLVEELGDFLG